MRAQGGKEPNDERFDRMITSVRFAERSATFHAFERSSIVVLLGDDLLGEKSRPEIVASGDVGQFSS